MLFRSAADVIVGVPGETEQHHRQAMDFISSLGISALHVFTYSIRPGTKAAQMAEQVQPAERHQRSVQLHELSKHLQRKFIETQLSATRPVLFEKEQKDGYIYGFTDNYLRVRVHSRPELSNHIVDTKLISINDDLTIEGATI